MSVVLVTVVGPAGRLDLVVPAEPPVAALLDPLARAHGAGASWPAAGGWRLRPLDGDPLPIGASLAAGGVRDGAVLVLAEAGPPSGPAPAPRRSPVIGVLSAAAGLGTTTVAALLGRALAAGTGRLTVAVDANPGAGSLSQRLAPGHDITAADLLALIDHPALTRAELLAFLAWCGPRLGLLASGPRRDRGPPLVEREWRRLLGGLAGHGLVQVVDCAPGLDDPGTRAVVASADQMVLVVEPSPAPASRRLAHVLTDLGLPLVAVPRPIPPRSTSRSRQPSRRPGPRDLEGPPPGAWGDPWPKVGADGAPGAHRHPSPGAHRDLGPGAHGDPGSGAHGDPGPVGWWNQVSGAWEERVWRVAEALAADWAALGFAVPACAVAPTHERGRRSRLLAADGRGR